MTSREKAKKGLMLLQEAILDLIKEKGEISTSDIAKELAIESSDKNGTNKNYFCFFILECCAGTVKAKVLGNNLKALFSESIESNKQSNRRYWKIKD